MKIYVIIKKNILLFVLKQAKVLIFIDKKWQKKLLENLHERIELSSVLANIRRTKILLI